MKRTRTEAIAILLAAGWTPQECDAVVNYIELRTVHHYHQVPQIEKQPFYIERSPKPPINPNEITCLHSLKFPTE